MRGLIRKNASKCIKMHAQICVLVFIHFSEVTPRTSKREEGAEARGEKCHLPQSLTHIASAPGSSSVLQIQQGNVRG